MKKDAPEAQKQINLWAVSAIVGLLVLLALMGIRLIQNDASPVGLGEKPKDFSLMTYDGDVIHTTDLRGKVVLINFWASWCTTCDGEAALLSEAWQYYQTDKSDRVIFLGVAYMDTEPASRAFIDQHGMRYHNGPDLRGEISRIYQVNSVPETFILDADGTLRHLKIGAFTSLDEVLTAIDATLALSLD